MKYLVLFIFAFSLSLSLSAKAQSYKINFVYCGVANIVECNDPIAFFIIPYDPNNVDNPYHQEPILIKSRDFTMRRLKKGSFLCIGVQVKYNTPIASSIIFEEEDLDNHTYRYPIPKPDIDLYKTCLFLSHNQPELCEKYIKKDPTDKNKVTMNADDVN